MTTVENRATGRVRSFLRGEILHSNGNSRTECTIRDLSAGGARIEAPQSVTVPEFFDLFIPQRNLRHRVKMIWRHASEFGVSFQNEHQPPVPSIEENPNEIRMRMLELELETAKLKSQIAEMRTIIELLVKERKTA
ncbi:MAG: pilus assembly protein PilZ [Rhizobiales bacterium PAR1]|nr:MAG: pilus assembly protein PilZ [Rhizobiales bacterium PAR1]